MAQSDDEIIFENARFLNSSLGKEFDFIRVLQTYSKSRADHTEEAKTTLETLASGMQEVTKALEALQKRYADGKYKYYSTELINFKAASKRRQIGELATRLILDLFVHRTLRYNEIWDHQNFKALTIIWSEITVVIKSLQKQEDQQ